jgi:hypothetical protein
MKNSKELSKLSTIDAGFAERTGVLESLRNQAPKVIEEMIELLTTANKDCENHLHEFAFDLYGIACLHGRRFKSPVINYTHPDIPTHPDYLANQNERRKKLEEAAQTLTGLTEDLCQLDAYHFQNFISLYKTPTGRTKYYGPLEVIAEIRTAARVIAACQEAHSSIFKAPIKKRRRPPIPYVDATGELISLWERCTGEKVPVSKTHEHEVATNAARFILLGLSLIDPNVTDAKAVTLINNALSQS